MQWVFAYQADVKRIKLNMLCYYLVWTCYWKICKGWTMYHKIIKEMGTLAKNKHQFDYHKISWDLKKMLKVLKGNGESVEIIKRN